MLGWKQSLPPKEKVFVFGVWPLEAVQFKRRQEKSPSVIPRHHIKWYVATAYSSPPPPPSPAVSCVLPWWESHLPLWASHPCCWSSRHTGSSKEGYQSHCLSSCAHGAKATFFSTSPSSRRCLQVEQVKQSEVQSGTGINQTERGHLACGALGLHLTFLHSFSL